MTRRLLALLGFCILTLVCAAFVHLNAVPVELDLFVGELHAPLAYTLIGAFALGWLVTVIGAKLVADWLINTPQDPRRLDLHSPASAGFWAFWVAMLLAFLFGFLPRRQTTTA